MSGDYSNFPSPTVDVGTRGTDTPLTTTASITWISANDDVEVQDAIQIDFGRQNEISQADPNVCTLTFAASEFKVDASGPYAKITPSNALIGVGVPLRVRAQPNGQAVRNRFVGYIESITPVWPSGNLDTGLRIQVRASSRLAWMGRAKSLQDRTSAAILALGATSYWPMTESTESNDGTVKSSPPWHEFDDQPRIWVRASGEDKATKGAFAKTPNEEWGASPDGLKVAAFKPVPAGDSHLSAQVRKMPVISSTAAWSVTMIARLGRTERTESAEFLPFTLHSDADFQFNGNPRYVFAWNAYQKNAEWEIYAINGGSTDIVQVAAPGIRDTEWHLFTLTSGGGATPTLRAYYDDELVATLSVASGGFTLRQIGVGESTYFDVDGKPVDLKHEFGRLAIWNGTRLTDSQVASLYDDIVNQDGEGDTVTQRLQRWAEYAGYPTSQITITSPGDTPLLPQPPVGTALALMQDVATTDGGFLFDRRNGNIRYLGPLVRTTASTASIALDASVSEPGNLAVTADTSEVVNQVTVKAADESETVVREDAASIALIGYNAQEHTLITASQPHLRERADWLLYKFGNPVPRMPAITVSVTSLSSGKQAQLLSESFEPGSLVTLSNIPTAINGVPTSCYLEGMTEVYGPGTCEVTLYVSDASAEAATFLLDDTTRGDLNSAYVIG
ncbi:hypothetical protein [Nocardioides stalactiti]|uniref:hypothetical protein n=1 Tax=Nocardioides stalactiti TaxID=2755356 RepID=UPI00160330FE|nr:hypothetical protein [Nocardioides stalactiti]